MARFWRVSAVLAALCVALAAMAVGAAAAKRHEGHGSKRAKPTAGQLDRDFGKGGKVLVHTPRSEAGTTMTIANASHGTFYVERRQGFNLYAFEADGHPELSFGKNGRVHLPIYGNDIAIDAKGRILTVGSAATSPITALQGSDAEVLRYLPSGKLDASFGEGGVLRTTFGLPKPQTLEAASGHYFEAPIVNGEGVAIDAEGLPIVSGSTVVSASINPGEACNARSSAFVARLTTGGKLDPSFGSGGVVTLPSLAEGLETTLAANVAFGPALAQRSVKSCLTGTGPGGPLAPGALTVRGGLVSIPQGTNAETLAVDSKGRYLLSTYIDQQERVERLQPNGTLDLSFGTAGMASLPLGPEDTIEALDSDAKGRVLVGVRPNMNGIGGAESFDIYRLKASGKLDASFANDGEAITNFGGDSRVRGIGISPHGRILAVGTLTKGSASAPEEELAIARYLP